MVDKRVELSPLIAGGGMNAVCVQVPKMSRRSWVPGWPVRCCARNRRNFRRDSKVLQGSWKLDCMRWVRRYLPTTGRLPNTSYFALPDIDGETLVGKLDRAGFRWPAARPVRAPSASLACSRGHGRTGNFGAWRGKGQPGAWQHGGPSRVKESIVRDGTAIGTNVGCNDLNL